jgi:DNA-binding NarL/FixJ family response regulator
MKSCETNMRRPTILLADDHVVFTDGIVRILKDRFDVVGTVTDGSLLAEAASRLHPDVVVTDISMPTVSGLEALRQLKARHVEGRVIFLTMHADASLAAEAFRLGARGFVLKHSSGEELVKAIQAVLEGHKYMSSALTDEVLALMSEPRGPSSAELTTRQKEVLRLIVNGHRMKEIAAHLKLSPRTVETIKYEMMRDLNIHSTTELVRFAIEHRLVAF